jgi:hypothetical protein
LNTQSLTAPGERRLPPYFNIDRDIAVMAGRSRIIYAYQKIFAAMLNLLYSLYVVVVYLLKSDVVPGWTTMSLQLSGRQCPGRC